MDLPPQKSENLADSDEKLNENISELRDKYKALEHRHEMLCQLNKLSNEADNLYDFFQQIYRLIQSGISAEKFYVIFFDATFDTIEFPFWVDENATFTAGPKSIKDYEGTLIKYVIDTKKPLLTTPYKIDELIDTECIEYLDNSIQWLGVPLKKDGYVSGVIAIENSTTADVYNDDDLKILLFIAEHVVCAINRMQDLDMLKTAVSARTSELMEHIREQEKSDLLQDSLYRISELVNDVRIELSEFYTKVHYIIGRLINAENFYIVKYSEESETLSFIYSVDSKGKNSIKELAPRKKGKYLTELVINTEETLLFNAQDIEQLYTNGEIDFYDKDTKAWLGIPLIHSGKLIGVMIICSYEKTVTYNEQDADLLNFVSQGISSAIKRRELITLERQTHDILEQQVKLRTLALEEEISQRKLIQEQLTHTASHDNLTGLANRIIFVDLLNHAIESSKRFPERLFAILFLDLDRFKVVNDSLGHHAGDKLLKIIADELLSTVRTKDTVARLGGDEFVILIEDLESDQEAYEVAQRITDFLSTPFVIDDHPVYIGTSIGVLFNNERYDDADFMLRDADTAMYHAKENGRGRYEVFDASMQSDIQNALSLEADIRDAIYANEFIPYFQPIVHLETGKITGFEALARWQSNKRGFVFPNDFIPLAEDRNLVMMIDLQILEKSCLQLKKWQDQFGFKDLYISCNLYCDHFFSQTLTQDIEKILNKIGIPPQNLRVELTERALLNNNDVVLDNMKELKKLGVKILLDDFGTGYSSLSYLHLFPIDVLKIDRSFITNVHDHISHQAIIKTIIDLATNLNMATVGEGIESIEDSNILSGMECQYGQGYYFSKPMQASDAENALMNVLCYK